MLKRKVRRRVTCQERRDLLLLYVAGALDPAEAVEMRAHLMTGCPACAAGLVEAEAVVHRIPEGLARVAAPAGAWEKVEGRIGRVGAVGVIRPEKGRGPAWMGWAAAAVILMGMGILLRHSNEELRNAELRENAVLSEGQMVRDRAERAERELGETKAALVAAQNMEKSIGTRLTGLEQKMKDMAADNTKMLVQMQSSKQEMMGTVRHMLNAERYDVAAMKMEGVKGTVYVDHADGMVVLAAANLKALPAGKTFELWIIPEEGSPVAAGTFEVGARGVAMHEYAMPREMGKMATVAVTDEPMGGVEKPTGSVLFEAEIK